MSKRTNHSTYLKRVNTLASQIYKSVNKTISWSEAMSWAHYYVKHNACKLISFVKKCGTESKRVVSTSLGDFIKFTGTGSPNKYSKAVDLAKVAYKQITGKSKSVVISFIKGYTTLA